MVYLDNQLSFQFGVRIMLVSGLYLTSLRRRLSFGSSRNLSPVGGPDRLRDETKECLRRRLILNSPMTAIRISVSLPIRTAFHNRLYYK